MPNWCFNSITITGCRDDVNRLLNEATKKNEKGKIIEFDERGIIDHPYIYIETENNDSIAVAKTEDVGKYGIDSAKNSHVSGTRKEEAILIPIGYEVFDWYSWNNENYGTKWGLCDQYFGDITTNDDEDLMTIEYSCNSAWSMPDGIMRAMCERFHVDIEMWSEEGGCSLYGKFCFEWDYSNQEVMEMSEDFESETAMIIARDNISESEIETCLHCGKQVVTSNQDWDEKLKACFDCYDELDWMEDGEEKEEHLKEMNLKVAKFNNME